jgi:hypothetical protein
LLLPSEILPRTGNPQVNPPVPSVSSVSPTLPPLIAKPAGELISIPPGAVIDIPDTLPSASAVAIWWKFEFIPFLLVIVFFHYYI